jgi:hypothetical protein
MSELNLEDVQRGLAEIVRGPPGRDGRDGRDGLDGVEGKPGPMGPRGFSGKDGALGRSGRDGKDGVDGQDGLNGKDGAPGEHGRDGVDGAPGKRGLQGLQGPQGEPGPQGPRGDIGPMPRHEWEDTRLRFEIAPGRWGRSVDLQGPPGKSGRVQVVGGGGTTTSSESSSTSSGNTLRSGSGAPDDSLGNDGDFYIDTTAWRIHGPKASGAWAAATTEVRVLETMSSPGTVSDNGPFEFGMKLGFEVGGYITALRFYKPSGDSGFTPRIAHVWDADGVELASVTFSSETSSGWQEADLDDPLAVGEGAVLIVSYNTGAKVPYTVGGISSVPANSDVTPVSGIYSSGGAGGVGTFPTNAVAGQLMFADVVYSIRGTNLRGPRGLSA